MRRRVRALGRKERFGRNPDLPRKIPGSEFSLRAVLIDQQDRLFLWAPVLIASGVAFWVALPREPSLWALGGSMVGLALIGWWLRHRLTALLVITALLLLTFGQFWIAWQAHRAGGPVVAERTGAIMVTGSVLKVEPRKEGRLRLTLGRVSLPGYRPETVPHRVRISLRPSQYQGLSLMPGQRVTLRAILMPLPDAAIPGGFDFSRQAHFMKLGGLGFALSEPEIQARAIRSEVTSGMGLWAAVDRVRLAIDARIKATLADEQAVIASALIVGVRGAIPDELRETLRIAGLAHILAISGLHMALIAGGVFFVVRAGLALAPPLALRQSPRRTAAWAGLMAACIYLLLSGATVATQRAFVMALIVFLAMLLDRPALTLRAVALAALVVLAIDPSAALNAGFQMSFAATAALVSGYESLRQRTHRSRTEEPGWCNAVWLRPARFVAALALTSLIAGLATGPIAAFHFNHVASYGLVGNVLAMPVLTLATMPLAALALVLMPFGLEPIALVPMGLSIDAIVRISSWVSALPRADTVVVGLPALVLPLVLLSGCWLIIWTQPIRYVGLAGFAGAALLAISTPQPDILIARDGRMVGLMATSHEEGASNGDLRAVATSRSAFTLETWLRRMGDPRPEGTPDLRTIRCTGSPCHLTGQLPGRATPVSVAIERYGDDIGALCASHDVVVLPSHSPRGNPIPLQAGRNRDDPRCDSALVINRHMLAQRGALALYRAREPQIAGATLIQGHLGWTIRGARDHNRHRIWSPANRVHLTPNSTHESPQPAGCPD